MREDGKSGLAEREAAVVSETIAQWIVNISRQARENTGLNRVGLTGGVFQNLTLLRRAVALLRPQAFEVLTHRIVPANDGGLALGQAALAILAHGRDTL